MSLRWHPRARRAYVVCPLQLHDIADLHQRPRRICKGTGRRVQNPCLRGVAWERRRVPGLVRIVGRAAQLRCGHHSGCEALHGRVDRMPCVLGESARAGVERRRRRAFDGPRGALRRAKRAHDPVDTLHATQAQDQVLAQESGLLSGKRGAKINV